MIRLTDKVIQLLLGCVLVEKKRREKTAPGADLLHVLSPGERNGFLTRFLNLSSFALCLRVPTLSSLPRPKWK